MVLDDLTLTKVSLARQLLSRATTAAAEPGALGPAVGVSLGQDALELILSAVAEHYKVKLPKRVTFDQLIVEVSKAVSISPSTRLLQINGARVGFKHHGILPETQLAKKLVAFASIAADEICRECLSVSLWSVSATQLVTRTRVRNYLNESVRLKDAGEFEESVCYSAMAFAIVYGPLYSSRGLDRNSDFRMGRVAFGGYGGGSSRDEYGTLARAISDVAHAATHDLEDVYGELETLRNQMHSLKLGIDLDQLARFEALVPDIGIARAGGLSIIWKMKPKTFSLDDAEFCFDFAFDAILRSRRTSTPTSSTELVMVHQQTPIVIVNPSPQAPEVIRMAQLDEQFSRPRQPDDPRGYLQIVFEGDIAYVSSKDAAVAVHT